ncbi:hypothetical protein [Azospirillum sp. sgz301742]
MRHPRDIPHHIKVKTVVTAGVSLVTMLSLAITIGYLPEAFTQSVHITGLLVNLIWIWE